MDRQQDHWAQWLLNRRFGGDAAGADERARFMERLLGVRDQILDRWRWSPAKHFLMLVVGTALSASGRSRVGRAQGCSATSLPI
jgi:hypothetical protein